MPVKKCNLKMHTRKYIRFLKNQHTKTVYNEVIAKELYLTKKFPTDAQV